MISVILGADTSDVRFSEAGRLMDYGFRNYQSNQLVAKGQKVCDVTVFKGTIDTVELIASDNLNIVCKKNSDESFNTKIALPEKINAPISAGQKLGELIVFKGGEEINKIDIVASCDIPKISVANSILKGFKALFTKLVSFEKNIDDLSSIEDNVTN